MYSYNDKLHSNQKEQLTAIPKYKNGTQKHINERKTETKIEFTAWSPYMKFRKKN